jgi:hypothetical protein
MSTDFAGASVNKPTNQPTNQPQNVTVNDSPTNKMLYFKANLISSTALKTAIMQLHALKSSFKYF